MDIKVGDYVKTDVGQRAFKVAGITEEDTRTIPKGWLIDEEGRFINPKFCMKYTGALSAIVGLNTQRV